MKGNTPITNEKEQHPTLFTKSNDNQKKEEIGKSNPIPFILTLIVGDKLLHNSMIDFGVSTTIMPKQIVEALMLEYEPLNRGVGQLDGQKIQDISIIKNLPLTLYSWPNIVAPQEVVIVYIHPIFGHYLSCDFIKNIGG